MARIIPCVVFSFHHATALTGISHTLVFVFFSFFFFILLCVCAFFSCVAVLCVLLCTPGAGGHHVPKKGRVVLVEVPLLGARVGLRDSHQALQVKPYVLLYKKNALPMLFETVFFSCFVEGTAMPFSRSKLKANTKGVRWEGGEGGQRQRNHSELTPAGATKNTARCGTGIRCGLASGIDGMKNESAFAVWYAARRQATIMAFASLTAYCCRVFLLGAIVSFQTEHFLDRLSINNIGVMSRDFSGVVHSEYPQTQPYSCSFSAPLQIKRRIERRKKCIQVLYDFGVTCTSAV